MLVLSRKRNERLCIGGDIEIVIVDIRGDKVRLGIQAPDNVTVDRYEVRQEINNRGGVRMTAEEKAAKKFDAERRLYEQLKAKFEAA